MAATITTSMTPGVATIKEADPNQTWSLSSVIQQLAKITLSYFQPAASTVKVPVADSPAKILPLKLIILDSNLNNFSAGADINILSPKTAARIEPIPENRPCTPSPVKEIARKVFTWK